MRATEKLTTAKTLQSQLGTMDVSDPALHLDTILKCQSLINTLQDPGEKAMECFTSVSDRFLIDMGGLTPTSVYHVQLPGCRQ